MDFSLSSSLVGNAVSNPDKLALDLQFATDKTLTARKGPTPVFVRGSGATFVDSDKLVKWAPENLLLQSEAFTDSYWLPLRAVAFADQTTSPLGILNADKFISDTSVTNNHRIDRTTVILSLNTVHTISVFAKASEYSGFGMGVDSVSPVIGVQFSLLGSGSVTAQASGYTGTIQNVGDGWFRCTATFTSSASATNHRVYLYVGQNGTTFTYTGDGTSGIFIWGAQLERSSTARTYNPTTTAAFYGPRFDHDPITGVCKGLLMEESRTNLILQSENLGTTWSASQLNITGTPAYINTAAAPTGLTTAEKLIANTTTSTHQFRQDVTLVAASIYTVSCYFKAAEHTTVSIAMVGSGTGGIDWSAFYNVSTGVKTGVVTGFSSSEITNAGNGWYRCSVTFTAVNSGATGVRFGGANTAGNNLFYTGDNSGGLFIWGAQLEVGSFPTSYIPTTTASVVRSADVCSITGSAFSGFYNQPEGTLFADVAPQTAAQVSTVLAFNTVTFQDAHLIYKVDSTINSAGRRWAGQTSVGTTAQTAIVTSTDVAISRSRLSYAYKLNDFAFAYAGGIVGTDNLGNIPSPTAMRIGSRDDGLSINGHLAAVRYYKKRLSNPRLQAITV